MDDQLGKQGAHLGKIAGRLPVQLQKHGFEEGEEPLGVLTEPFPGVQEFLEERIAGTELFCLEIDTVFPHGILEVWNLFMINFRSGDVEGIGSNGKGVSLQLQSPHTGGHIVDLIAPAAMTVTGQGNGKSVQGKAVCVKRNAFQGKRNVQSIEGKFHHEAPLVVIQNTTGYYDKHSIPDLTEADKKDSKKRHRECRIVWFLS